MPGQEAGDHSKKPALAIIGIIDSFLNNITPLIQPLLFRIFLNFCIFFSHVTIRPIQQFGPPFLYSIVIGRHHNMASSMLTMLHSIFQLFRRTLLSIRRMNKTKILFYFPYFRIAICFMNRKFLSIKTLWMNC